MDDYFFNSNLLYENLNILKQTYPFVQTGSAGKSIMGKDISYVKVGRGPKEVFYSASYHANEWITSIVLLEFLSEYCNAVQNNSTIFGFPARRLFETTSIYVIPLVNPDGVDLVTGALPKSSPSYKQAEKIAYGFATIPFPDGWKANIRGVDFKNYQPICKALQLFTCTILRTFIFILFYQFFYYYNKFYLLPNHYFFLK